MIRRPLVLAVPLLLGSVALLPSPSRAAGAAPTYETYAVGANSGEPSIGYDTQADAAVFTSGRKTVRMRWDAANKLVENKDVSDPDAVESFDPIGFTDQRTHRSFTSQLMLACSLLSYSDDAGTTWHPSTGCGPATLLDHQSVGGGPYPTENRPATAGLTGYPDAVYYCAQNSYNGTCARSDDGGRTFPFSSVAYNAKTVTSDDPYGGACSAIHGHLRVAGDGVVYLPIKGCGGEPDTGNLTNSEYFGGGPALSVSEDAGTTWTVRKVPGAHNQDESDPSVAFDKDNTVYFGWEDGINPSKTTYGTTSSARIAVSRDHGKTWSTPYDVSSGLGLRNVQFPEVIAGDPGRAAFAFLGTKTVGDDQHIGFNGIWHLYVASTTDGGAHWVTVDVTPDDPVQRGCVDLDLRPAQPARLQRHHRGQAGSRPRRLHRRLRRWLLQHRDEPQERLHGRAPDQRAAALPLRLLRLPGLGPRQDGYDAGRAHPVDEPPRRWPRRHGRCTRPRRPRGGAARGWWFRAPRTSRGLTRPGRKGQRA